MSSKKTLYFVSSVINAKNTLVLGLQYQNYYVSTPRNEVANLTFVVPAEFDESIFVQYVFWIFLRWTTGADSPPHPLYLDTEKKAGRYK
jgi:hypothetical protein